MSELLARLKKLPPHSVVLFSPLFYSDAAGRYYLPEEALGLICEAANVPVYGTNADHLGQGIVGGALYDLSASGVAAARMAQRILNGEPPAEIPIQELNPNHYMFDARQLLRWRIREARLPAGSTVLYRTASLWDLYRGYLLAGLAVLLFQAALIFTLVRQTRRLTSSESQLRDLSGRLITARTRSGSISRASCTMTSVSGLRHSGSSSACWHGRAGRRSRGASTVHFEVC